jgi:hypothetical protein
MVTGRLRQRSWETPEGDKRSGTEIEADEVGTSPKWGYGQGRADQPAWQRRTFQRSERQAERAATSTTLPDLLNAGRSPGSAAVGSRVPAGRSTTATAAIGLAPERLCGPADTRPGVAQQRLCVSSEAGLGPADGPGGTIRLCWPTDLPPRGIQADDGAHLDVAG